jgi:hypothetical protein
MLRHLPNLKVLGDSGFSTKMQGFQMIPRRYAYTRSQPTHCFTIRVYAANHEFLIQYTDL